MVRQGRVAAGSVHHIAFRARDDEEQRNWRDHLVELGYKRQPDYGSNLLSLD